MSTNTKQVDRFGIIAKAQELLPKLVHQKEGKRNELMSELEKNYEAVDKEMLTYLRSKMNEVKEISDFVDVWLNATSAYGAFMVRADILCMPLTHNEPSQSKHFADTIKNCATPSLISELDDILGDDFFCDYNDNQRADAVAHDAFGDGDKFAPIRDYSTVLPIMPLLDYLIKHPSAMHAGGLTWYFMSASSADAVLRTEWAKKRPLIGYLEKGEYNPHGFNSLGSDVWERNAAYSYHFEGGNGKFIALFAERLNRFYNEVKPGDIDFYTVSEWRNTTYSAVIRFLFDDIGNGDENRVFGGISHWLDFAESGTVITDDTILNNDYQRTPCADDLIMLKQLDINSGSTYIPNKPFLIGMLEMIESLNLTELQPGYSVVAEKIRKLA